MMERRREQRIGASLPLTAVALSGAGTGTVVNISLCGVMFAVDFPLQPKDLVLLHIDLDAHTSIQCLVQLVRVDEKDGRWVCGADLRYISASDRQRLSFMLLVLQDPSLAGRSQSAA